MGYVKISKGSFESNFDVVSAENIAMIKEDSGNKGIKVTYVGDIANYVLIGMATSTQKDVQAFVEAVSLIGGGAGSVDCVLPGGVAAEVSYAAVSA
tara:strand:+ start:6101 stop:6388 length:288 start_codon:yes stop_codon:yes gene_type:complete